MIQGIDALGPSVQRAAAVGEPPAVAAKVAENLKASGSLALRTVALEYQESDLPLRTQMLPATGMVGGEPFVGDAREERIRAIFTLPRAAGLPPVQKATLQEYFHYLATHLTLPFSAVYYDETPSAVAADCLVTVVGLPHPSRYALDCLTGLLCTARTGTGEAQLPLADMRVSEDHANHSLVEDYWYWLWNWR